MAYGIWRMADSLWSETIRLLRYAICHQLSAICDLPSAVSVRQRGKPLPRIRQFAQQIPCLAAVAPLHALHGAPGGAERIFGRGADALLVTHNGDKLGGLGFGPRGPR